jgi:hypothetical protein
LNKDNVRCPMCSYRFAIFRFSFPWHLWHRHSLVVETPPSGWTQTHVDEWYARRWQ